MTDFVWNELHKTEAKISEAAGLVGKLDHFISRLDELSKKELKAVIRMAHKELHGIVFDE